MMIRVDGKDEESATMSIASKYDTIPRAGTEALRARIASPVQFLGFVTAIVVPFVFISIVALGMAPEHPDVLGGLLLANVVGLVLGKDYGR